MASRCPLTHDADHAVTWRCYVLYAADWLLGAMPESWPHWTAKPLLALIRVVDVPLEGDGA